MNSKEYLYDASVIIQRAIKDSNQVRADVEAARLEAESKIIVPKKDKDKIGIILTDDETLNSLPDGSINKILLEEFNRRETSYKEFEEFALSNGYVSTPKEATAFARNKIKILRENCDTKFSNIIMLCKFLNIQLEFTIN